MVYKARGNGFVLQNERFRSDTRRKRWGLDLWFHKSIEISIWILVTKGLVDTVLGKRNGQSFQDSFCVYQATRETHQFTEKSMLSFT